MAARKGNWVPEKRKWPRRNTEFIQFSRGSNGLPTLFGCGCEKTQHQVHRTPRQAPVSTAKTTLSQREAATSLPVGKPSTMWNLEVCHDE